MHEWWVEDGCIRLRITTRGVLIGRGIECDIGVQDRRVSRRHVLVRLDDQTPVLEAVGRNGARVNGEFMRRHEVRALAAGDRFSIPGRTFCVRQTLSVAASAGGSEFFFCHDGGLYGINQVPFAVGGGAGDDLVIPAWPASALRVVVAGDALVVEAGHAVTLTGGRFLERGDLANLAHGDEIALAGESLRVLWRALPSQMSTLDVRKADSPKGARLQHLSGSGGRLVLSFADGDVAVVLAERRFDCVHGLLCPPDGYQPGDWISDDVLADIVWPRDHGKGRVDINVLLSRVRKDLAKRGIDGQALIQRKHGSTRFVLAPDASVRAGEESC